MSTSQPTRGARPRRPKRSGRSSTSFLRAPGLLGTYPLIGLILILVGSGGFGLVASDVRAHGPLTRLDLQLADALHQMALQSAPLVRTVMIGGFFLGEHVIFAIGAGLTFYFAWKRFWPELSMVLIAWPGELAILFLLSPYFHRPRPSFETPVWHVMNSPGFPSGHSISAVMCYGLLAYLIAPTLASRWHQILVIAGAVAIVIFIGISRVFVGDHYPTDVVAGVFIGIAWSGLVYTLVELVAKVRYVPDHSLRFGGGSH